MIEVYHPYGHLVVFITFQVSIAMGTLGFNLVWPYMGLIGSSPGVYGLMGGCISILTFNRNVVHPGIAFIVPFIILSHLITEVILYIVAYSQQTAYSSHVFGCITGFLFMTALLGPLKSSDSQQRTTTSLIAGVMLLCMILACIVHYLTEFPIVDHEQYLSFNNKWHNKQVIHTNCCASLFYILNQYNEVQFNDVMQTAICNHNLLYSPYLNVRRNPFDVLLTTNQSVLAMKESFYDVFIA